MTKEQEAIEKLVEQVAMQHCPPSKKAAAEHCPPMKQVVRRCEKTRDYGDAECRRCWKIWAGLDVEAEKAKD